jgi:hypothetical protein
MMPGMECMQICYGNFLNVKQQHGTRAKFSVTFQFYSDD